MDIYVDFAPANIRYTKVLPVVVSGDTLNPARISPSCFNFTDDRDQQSIDPILSRWEKVFFPCNPNKVQNTVGIGALEKEEAGVVVSDKNIIVVYTDHSSSIDNSIFIDIIASMRIK